MWIMLISFLFCGLGPASLITASDEGRPSLIGSHGDDDVDDDDDVHDDDDDDDVDDDADDDDNNDEDL